MHAPTKRHGHSLKGHVMQSSGHLASRWRPSPRRSPCIHAEKGYNASYSVNTANDSPFSSSSPTSRVQQARRCDPASVQASASIKQALHIDNEGILQPSRLLVTARGKLPNQAGSVFNPTDTAEDLLARVPVAEAPTKSVSDLDYLTELLAIQQSDGPKNVGFFGTRNMGVTHQKLVEILSYAYASTGNHIYTSGSIGTNAAVIKGALRANTPDKLTVILPQSLRRQPQESQELLQQVINLVEMPENDDLSLLEASRICNQKIVSHVQQVICFAFHDSRLLLETCHHAKELRKIVTLFYLD